MCIYIYICVYIYIYSILYIYVNESGSIRDILMGSYGCVEQYETTDDADG